MRSQSGYLPIKFTPDNSVIYKTVSGFCDNYAVNFINNQHFEVATNLNVDHAPTLLKLEKRVATLLTFPFRIGLRSESYKKYDVTYFGFNSDGYHKWNQARELLLL